MLVRRTYLYHSHIAWKSTASVQLLCLAQEYRDIVGISRLYRLAYVGSDEESLMEEDTVKFRVGIRCRTFCVKMMDTNVLQLSSFTSCAKCIDEYFRCTCDAAEMNVVSGFDHLYGLFGRYVFDFLKHNVFF